MPAVKICGLFREIDIEYVNKVKPEYIGFVFYPKSKRYVSYERAKELSSTLDKSILRVGVFLDEDINNVIASVKNNIVDIVQLHGHEDDAYVRQVREAIGNAKIIQAFNIKDESDIERANNSLADLVLLDHGAGGTGEVFDWSMIKAISREFILAGGLNLNNIEEAVEYFNPDIVDVSSGVETDGYKDYEKIENFVKIVRSKSIA